MVHSGAFFMSFLLHCVHCVSVIEFGAKGDGETDDIAAIENALASIQSSGGTVIFPPPGRYAVSRPIIVNGQDILLKGAGAQLPSCGNASGTGSSILSLHRRYF